MSRRILIGSATLVGLGAVWLLVPGPLDRAPVAGPSPVLPVELLPTPGEVARGEGPVSDQPR